MACGEGGSVSSSKCLYSRAFLARSLICDRYALRIPDGYNRVKGRSPVVFLHGLGLGIWQYQIMLRHFFEKLSDTPFLVILNPQTSQDFFHPLFLKPMLPAEMVASMGALLESLGWVGPTGQDGENKGVTILSHSK